MDADQPESGAAGPVAKFRAGVGNERHGLSWNPARAPNRVSRLQARLAVGSVAVSPRAHGLAVQAKTLGRARNPVDLHVREHGQALPNLRPIR